MDTRNDYSYRTAADYGSHVYGTYAQRDYLVYKVSNDPNAPLAKMVQASLTYGDAVRLANLLNAETGSGLYRQCPMTRWLAAIRASNEAFNNTLAGK